MDCQAPDKARKKHAMALPFIIDQTKFDALSDVEKAHYNQGTDGKFVLDCPGAVPNARLDEFRTNNTTLKTQLEAYGDITAEEAKTLRAKKKEIEESKAKTPEEINKIVEERVATMRGDHERELNTVKEKLTTAQRQLSERTIDAGLLEEGSKLGLRSTAHDDIVARGRGVWQLGDDGKPVAIDSKGEKIYGKTGEPLTMSEWVEGLAKSAAHLFESSEGGGAGGSGNGPKGGAGGTGANPWKTESFNLSEQAKILKQDRALAQRLAAQANVRI